MNIAGKAALAGGTVSTARFPALRHRNFRLIWTGQIVSNVGTWMQGVGAGWLVLHLKNSPLWLGLLGLSFAIPMIALPLIGGAVVDRVDRIRLLYITQSCQMVNAMLLGVSTYVGVVNIWHILGASFVGASLLAFDNPARNSLIPNVVPPHNLMNAISLNSAIYSGAALAGPALAGVLMESLGPACLFILNGVSFLAMLVALKSMRDVPGHLGRPQGSFIVSIQTGLSHVRRDRLLRTLLLLFAVTAIFGRSYQGLLPVFARDIWRGGPRGYGLLLSSSGAGALAGAFGLAAFTEVKRQGRVMIVNGLVFSLSLAFFALSPTIMTGSLFLCIAGMSATIFGSLIATFIQRATPNELRGRVMSLYTIAMIGLPSLGALSSGAIAEILGGISGAPRAVLTGAFIAGLAVLLFSPFMWRYGQGDG